MRRAALPGGLTQAMKALRITCRATYEIANRGARSPNASGIAMDISRLASITTSSTTRTGGLSGSTKLVIQVV